MMSSPAHTQRGSLEIAAALQTSSSHPAVDVLDDVRELLLQALTQHGKPLIRHARVLHRGEYEETASTRPRN
jgi:hypothetical protein